jgi:hypothetical protein
MFRLVFSYIFIPVPDDGCMKKPKHVAHVEQYTVSSEDSFVIAGQSVFLQRVILHFITRKDTPQSVRLLWTRDRPVAQTST